MKNIKRWFENDTINSGQHYDICEYDGHLEAKTDSALFMAVSPHDGTNYKMLLECLSEDYRQLEKDCCQ